MKIGSADRRARKLYLTKKAKPLLQQVWRVAEMTREEVFAGVSKADRETFMRVVPHVLDRINGIVEQLLELARPSRLQPAPLVLPAVLDRVLELYANELDAKEITVTREYAREVPSITADPERLYEAVVNLVSNALAAMGPRGRLTVRTGWHRPVDSGGRSGAGRRVRIDGDHSVQPRAVRTDEQHGIVGLEIG